MAFDVGGGKGGIRPAMNVTPLVDVVLVLLIIFMVVTPLMTKHMEMTVPGKSDDKDAPAPPPSPDALPPVVLTLTQSGALQINREDVPRDQVVARLQRMINARPDKIVFFDAGDEVPYGSAMEVLDLARGGGLTVAVLPEALAEPSAAAP